jgi:hypothetical protein
MSKKKGYQGWDNYETWAMALWMNNDQGLQEMALEWAAEAKAEAIGGAKKDRKDEAKFALADRLKDFWEENTPELEGPWSDLLSSALSEVNWDELAATYLEDSR